MDVAHTTKADHLAALQEEFLRARQAYHDARGRMLVAKLPFLDGLTDRAVRRLPPRVKREEVQSEAVTAMLKVLDKWDARRGDLEAYARPRVVGAIGDWVRKKRKTEAHFSLDDLAADRD